MAAKFRLFSTIFTFSKSFKHFCFFGLGGWVYWWQGLLLHFLGEGAALFQGFLLDVARPLWVNRVNFPSIATNSFWFSLGWGFIFFFFFCVIFDLIFLSSGLLFLFGVVGVGVWLPVCKAVLLLHNLCSFRLGVGSGVLG